MMYVVVMKRVLSFLNWVAGVAAALLWLFIAWMMLKAVDSVQTDLMKDLLRFIGACLFMIYGMRLESSKPK